jgi:dTDP-4-dehydrorhamnose 3,5-epimerase
MRFTRTTIPGVVVIDLEVAQDERGSFARTFCRREFEEHGLDPEIAQTNLSTNRRAGTLRGLHLQRPPYAEAKTVRVARGAVLDVVVDLRPGAPTYLDHLTVELSAANGRAVHVPEGRAHGFLTLDDDTEVVYLMSDYFVADAGDGLRWDDPALGIRWPREVEVISERDAAWPLLSERTDLVLPVREVEVP